MSNIDLLESVIQVAGTGGFAAALVKGIEAVSRHRQKLAAEQTKRVEAEAHVVTTTEREETARQRLHIEELGVAERLVLDRAQEHKDCLEQVKSATKEAAKSAAEAAAAKAEAAAAKAEAAKVDAIAEECRKDRAELHGLLGWMRRRLDKLDGGSAPPPPSDMFGSPAE